jgi:AcrR family transcriptional regulator
MARPRKMPDEAIFNHVHALMQERGAEGVTFASVAERSGLSGATLVQRFGTKQKLVHAALVHAWEGLEERTRLFAEEAEHSPEGAVRLLQKLSGGYGDIDTYADNLQILREDLRDLELRARGAAWIETLVVTLERCFSTAPNAPEGVGQLMVAQWQGALLLWGFSPEGAVDLFVREHLERCVRTLLR